MIWIKRAVVSAAVIAAVVTVLAQAQHLAWSTASVENHSQTVLHDVILEIVDERVARKRTGRLRPGESAFVILPDSGEAVLTVRLVANGVEHSGCGHYVEGRMYHSEVRIDHRLTITCKVSVSAFQEKLMILEMM